MNVTVSRLNKPAANASSEERAALMDELTDIYLLYTQEKPGSVTRGSCT